MKNIRAIQTHYDGYHFRSRAEARWAVFFNHAGMRYEYEKEGYQLPIGRYLPDFFLPDLGVWLEVKGVLPTDREIALAVHLHIMTDFEVLIAIGAPSATDQIIRVPQREHEGESTRYHFCDDRKNKGEFWLQSEESGCFSIGPSSGVDHGKYPGIFSATRDGYAASRFARFEFGGK
jgi:hypothetical protein